MNVVFLLNNQIVYSLIYILNVYYKETKIFIKPK